MGELDYADEVDITLDSPHDDLLEALCGAGIAFHLAGVKRPKQISVGGNGVRLPHGYANNNGLS